MEPLLAIGLWNVALAAALALVVFGIGRAWRRPAVLHCLWLLVLLKLLSPPLLPLPVLAPEPVVPEPAPVVRAEAPAPEPAFEPITFELKLEPGEAEGMPTIVLRQRPAPAAETKPQPAPVQQAEIAAPP